MKEAVLVYPMTAMVLLTAAVLAILFRSRVRAVREGKVTARYSSETKRHHESGVLAGGSS